MFVYPEASVSKKKRVCVRVVPVGSVETAVLNIKLTAKSKMMLQHYTYVGLVPLTYTNIQVKLTHYISKLKVSSIQKCILQLVAMKK